MTAPCLWYVSSKVLSLRKIKQKSLSNIFQYSRFQAFKRIRNKVPCEDLSCPSTAFYLVCCQSFGDRFSPFYDAKRSASCLLSSLSSRPFQLSRYCDTLKVPSLLVISSVCELASSNISVICFFFKHAHRIFINLPWNHIFSSSTWFLTNLLIVYYLLPRNMIFAI